MNYRNEIYNEYVSKHSQQLYGKKDISDIKKQFPVWNKYYGRHLPKNKNIQILEIGCGNGGFLYYLKKSGYSNYHGIDISDEQINQAKKLGLLNVEIADIKTYLEDTTKKYDVIIARDIIEHFKKQEIIDIIKLIFNTLSTNGKLIIQTPNAEGPFGSRYRYRDFTHEIAFTRSSLSNILRITGFKKILFYPTEPVPRYSLKSAVRFLLWKTIEVVLKFYVLVENGSAEGIYTQNIIAVAKK
ncbi:MAG: class I SAM-dependent methyltransferase [Atribacterota bacterium]